MAVVSHLEFYRAAIARLQAQMPSIGVRSFPAQISSSNAPRQLREIWVAWRRDSSTPDTLGPGSSIIQQDEGALILAYLDRNEQTHEGALEMAEMARSALTGWSYADLKPLYSQSLSFVELANNFWVYQETFRLTLPYSQRSFNVATQE